MLLPVEEAEGSVWGDLRDAWSRLPFSQFYRPCFISLPLQCVLRLCNILHRSTEQTLTTPHVEDYFCQSRRDLFLLRFFAVCSRN